MSAPFLLLAAPLVLAPIFLAIRRWPQIAGPAAAGTAWLMAIILLGYDLVPQASGATWSVFSLTFTLTEQTQLLLVALYLAMGMIFLLSTFYTQNGIFVAFSLAVLSPLSAALMTDPLVNGAVFLLLAAGGLAILIQGNRAGSTLAALRFLSLTALALPLLLSAGWMIENNQFRFVDTVTLLTLVALLLLTASFPFQIWVAPVVRESSSLTPAVVFGVVQLAVVVFCLNLLIDRPFIYGNVQFQGVLNLSAAATLILSAVLTLSARSFGHQLGYLLLMSIGGVIAVIGSGDAVVVELTLTLLILRLIGLIIAGSGLAMIRTRASAVEGGVNEFAANEGLAWRTPLGVGLFVFGCLSLAGLPLTPGFAGIWPSVVVVGKQSSWLAAILVLSVAGGAFGILRRLIPLFARTDYTAITGRLSSESRREQVVSGAVLLAGAIFAFFPRLILAFTNSLADLF